MTVNVTKIIKLSLLVLTEAHAHPPLACRPRQQSLFFYDNGLSFVAKLTSKRYIIRPIPVLETNKK